MEDFFKPRVGEVFVFYLLNGIKIYGVIGGIFPWGLRLINSPELQDYVDSRKGRPVFIEGECFLHFQNVGTFVPLDMAREY